MTFGSFPEWFNDPEYRQYAAKRMLISKEYNDNIDSGQSITVWPAYLHQHPRFLKLAKTNKYAKNELINEGFAIPNE